MVMVPVPKPPAVAARTTAPLTVMALVRPLVPLKIRVPDGTPVPARIVVNGEALAPLRVAVPDWWVRVWKLVMLERFSVPLPMPRALLKALVPVPALITPPIVPPCQIKVSLAEPKVAPCIEPPAAKVSVVAPVPTDAS